MTDLAIHSNQRDWGNKAILNLPSLDLFQGTATAVGTSASTVQANGDFLFKIAGLTVETVQIQGSTDGGVSWSGALTPFVDSTMNLAASSNLGNGQFRLLFIQNASFTNFRFVKSNNAETVTVVLTFPMISAP